MRRISALASLGTWTVTILALLPAVAGQAAEAPAPRTFAVRHLDLTEAVSMLRGMTGIEEITADPQAGTIVAVAPPSTISQVDTLLKTFDTEQPQNSVPIEIRVFAFDRLSSREAVTLLRTKLSVRQIAMNPDQRRIAVRDTRERLDEAAKLLAEADVAGD